ncbi:MAG: IS5 family transposase, partial [Methanosarcina sp.]|nr:IS5 family transposase [Methanosarcina sp.]
MAKRKNVPDYEISDEFWNKIKSLLPLPKPKKKAGRPRADDKKIMNGIFYLLRTGCQWKALPRCYGAPSTVYDRFQEWQRAGLFEKMWQAGLLEYDNEKGLEWEWQAIDGANRHDKMLVKGTLDAIIIERPSHKVTQNMCMDKGYDFPDIRELVGNYGYTAHIRRRGEENIRRDIPGYRARRWVVERTHSWLNRFRRL